MRIATYLLFDLQCSDALETYRETFDAKLVCKHLFNEHMTKDPQLLGKGLSRRTQDQGLLHLYVRYRFILRL